MTTTYDPKLHKIVPIEPTEEMLEEASFTFREEVKKRSGMETFTAEQARVVEYEAMLSAAPEITLNQWQDISTAPHGSADKPETYILIGKRENGKTLVATGYKNEFGAFEWFGGGMMGITHWKPLDLIPTPPEN